MMPRAMTMSPDKAWDSNCTDNRTVVLPSPALGSMCGYVTAPCQLDGVGVCSLMLGPGCVPGLLFDQDAGNDLPLESSLQLESSATTAHFTIPTAILVEAMDGGGAWRVSIMDVSVRV